ncbi:MAG: glycoside hydrolase family 30 protein [Lachnospiraceae bacterium]|nr:glycoside hydrolase family 30 protein [Lachnospiraceae bacterium]
MLKEIKVVETHLASDTKLREVGGITFEKDKEGNDGREDCILNLYDEVEYQEILGFGGAFTEATTLNLSRVSPTLRKKVMEMYFDGERGIGYNFCRSTINNCDFSEDFYSYDDVDGDYALEHFDISHDRETILPAIREAKELSDGMLLYASPWSPPAWMKTNGKMSKGGKLKEDCRQAWAEYIAKYIQEYRKEGVDVWGVTVQNEAKAEQGWESCWYSAGEERDFVTGFLRPVFEKMGLGDKKIFFWDHNKERVADRAMETMCNQRARDCFDGIAVHWYSGDHFSALDVTHQLFPEKYIIASEQCTGKGKTPEQSGEKYAHDIIGDLNNWTNAWVDWNMFLHEDGGPDHWLEEQRASGLPKEKIWIGEAPIVYDRAKEALDIRSSYYYMGHFSKYIRRGAKRIGCSIYDSRLETCAFRNPDGSIVCVVLNRTDADHKICLRYKGELAEFVLKAHSIRTLVF